MISDSYVQFSTLHLHNWLVIAHFHKKIGREAHAQPSIYYHGVAETELNVFIVS